jgi:hypothetical protein
MYANKPISTFGRVILASMNVTFVTAFIDLQDESNTYRSPEKRIEFFKKLNDTGIRLHVFISPEHRDKIHLTNGIVETIYLEDLDTYHLSPVGLPDIRNEIKDTENFLILINSKIELVNRAINSGKHSSSHYAWIDFNIFHVLTEQSVSQLNVLSGARYPPRCMYIPGCWDTQVLWDSINWRFCGGFFLGDIESLRSFYELQCREYPNMPKLTWEVNTWAYLESLGWQCDWYLADHNDSMLNIPITHQSEE